MLLAVRTHWNSCLNMQRSRYFSNSNIHPKSEYLRRLHEQKRFVDQFNEKTDHHVALIVDEYRPNEFTKMVLTNHLENEKKVVLAAVHASICD